MKARPRTSSVTLGSFCWRASSWIARQEALERQADVEVGVARDLGREDAVGDAGLGCKIDVVNRLNAHRFIPIRPGKSTCVLAMMATVFALTSSPNDISASAAIRASPRPDSPTIRDEATMSFW